MYTFYAVYTHVSFCLSISVNMYIHICDEHVHARNPSDFTEHQKCQIYQHGEKSAISYLALFDPVTRARFLQHMQLGRANLISIAIHRWRIAALVIESWLNILVGKLQVAPNSSPLRDHIPQTLHTAPSVHHWIVM